MNALRKPIRCLVMGTLAVLTIAACSQPPLPEDNFYRLPVPSPKAQGVPVLQGLVEVKRFVADGLTGGRPLVYTSSADAPDVRTYHYHFWAEPPPIMLQNQLAAYLRARRVTRQVVTPDMRIEPDYVVTGKIRRFEQITGAPGAVLVELEIGLADRRTERLIHLDNYRVEVPTSGASVPAAVTAIGTAVGQIFDRFITDVRATAK